MQNSTSPLVVEASKYRLLRERLLAVYPCADEETLRDTLEGITDLHEMIAAVIRSALVDEALAAGLRSRLDEMKQRLGRLDERGRKKRQLALDAMNDVGFKKLEQPDFTATARTGSPSLVVVAEDSIPQAYWVPQPPRLDRQALLIELKRGGEVAGTQLSNCNPVLSVRIK
jgi:Siphovirus Gp157